MKWMPIVTAIVAWSIASLAVIAIRGKHLSRRFCLLVLLFSSLGAGSAQYFVFAGIRQTERLSGARLVGVSCLRITDDAYFIREQLIAPLSEGDNDQRNGAVVDWVGTFQLKAEDISATLASVEGNAFIRGNYSVWMGDIEFNRNQLDRAANRVATADEGTARQTNVASYMKILELVVEQLDRLAREMRSRRPEDNYE